MNKHIGLTIDIPHHEGEDLKISVEERRGEESPVINIYLDHTLCLTLDELDKLVEIGEVFKNAKSALGSKSP